MFTICYDYKLYNALFQILQGRLAVQKCHQCLNVWFCWLIYRFNENHCVETNSHALIAVSISHRACRYVDNRVQTMNTPKCDECAFIFCCTWYLNHGTLQPAMVPAGFYQNIRCFKSTQGSQPAITNCCWFHSDFYKCVMVRLSTQRACRALCSRVVFYVLFTNARMSVP